MQRETVSGSLCLSFACRWKNPPRLKSPGVHRKGVRKTRDTGLEMTLNAQSNALLRSWRAQRCWLRQQQLQLSPLASPDRSCLGGARPRPIVDMSYSRHFLDFQGSSIPTSMKKLVVTKLSPNFREAATLQRDVPVPLPGDGDLLVRNRWDPSFFSFSCLQLFSASSPFARVGSGSWSPLSCSRAHLPQLLTPLGRLSPTHALIHSLWAYQVVPAAIWRLLI